MKTIKTGDILVSKWGYDQTNVEFYLVLERTPKMVWLQEVGSKTVAANGFMSRRVVPDKSKAVGKPIFRKVQQTRWRKDSDNEEFVRLESYAHAYVWNGEAQTATEYA